MLKMNEILLFNDIKMRQILDNSKKIIKAHGHNSLTKKSVEVIQKMFAK